MSGKVPFLGELRRGEQVLRVACIGASLTEGYVNRGTEFYPYTALLSEHMPGLGLPGLTVEADNFGKSGEVTAEILRRATLTVFTPSKPKWDLAVILAGANDLGYGVPTEEIVQNLSQLGDTAVGHGCKKVFYMTIPPVADFLNTDEFHEAKVGLNTGIAEMCMSNAAFELIDLFAATVSGDGESALKELIDTDGLHFSKQGYIHMAKVVASALAAWYKVESS